MIFVECNTDKIFIRGFGIPKRLIKHEGNKNRVVKRIGQNKNAIGVIDEDPDSIQPKELGEYQIYKKESTIKLLIKKLVTSQSCRVKSIKNSF